MTIAPIASQFAALNRIARVLSRAAISNPLDLAEGGAGLATLTPKAFASGTAGLTKGYRINTRPTLFAPSGGVLTATADGNGWGLPSTTVKSGGAFSSTKEAFTQRIGIFTDAVSIDAVLLSQYYRVLVNGQYVSKAVATDGLTGGYNRLNIALTDTSRKFRRIDLEIPRGAFFGGKDSTLQTFYVGANDTLMPVNTGRRLKVSVYGDSFTTSTGASRTMLGWAPILGILLGGADVDIRQIAIGGTGYVNDAAGAQYTFGQHIADLDQDQFDLVIVAGGTNDGGLSGVQAAVLAFLQAARVKQPNAVFVVLGSWCGSTGPSANAITVENAISAAVSQWADPYAVFVPVCTATPETVINSLNGPVINAAGAPGGGSPDGTHPGDVGHEYLARWAAAAICNAFRLMGWI